MTDDEHGDYSDQHRRQALMLLPVAVSRFTGLPRDGFAGTKNWLFISVSPSYVSAFPTFQFAPTVVNYLSIPSLGLPVFQTEADWLSISISVSQFSALLVDQD